MSPCSAFSAPHLKLVSALQIQEERAEKIVLGVQMDAQDEEVEEYIEDEEDEEVRTLVLPLSVFGTQQLQALASCSAIKA